MPKIWTYYDAKGDRVGKRRAVFAGKEVLVTASVPMQVDQDSMHGVEYRDVYHLARPEDRRLFTSKKHMLQWFYEAAPAVVMTRSNR